MSGETDLALLIAGMNPRLDAELYVFATTPSDISPPPEALMSFREAEGLTLILPRDAAVRLGLPGIFPCRRITLEIHSSLEAVGFMAAIARRLAEAGMGVNPVAAFHHDHIFVPAHRAGEAMAILREMAKDADDEDAGSGS
ncbi:MAG: ACT domain-containing protein [Rhizobiaceae bacterium]|nr:ACT domain-containing protein [Rhizobiaceae bacterium]